VLDAKIKHYTNLLKEGADTRGQGLCWIIKKLRGLGIQATEEHFPPFLENKTIAIIFKLT
jgi:hypothetical protein